MGQGRQTATLQHTLWLLEHMSPHPLTTAAVATQYVTYKRTAWVLNMVCCDLMGTACAIISCIITQRNRLILWARFDSPLALQRAAAKAALGKL